MAYTPTRLYMGVPAQAGVTAYTSDGVITIIKQVTITNTGNVQGTCDLHLIPEGDSAGQSNCLISDLLVDPGTVIGLNLSQVLEAGDSIWVKQDSTNLTMTISGVTYI